MDLDKYPWQDVAAVFAAGCLTGGLVAAAAFWFFLL